MIQEAGNKIVFIQFIAEWCGPCKLIGNIVEELAAQYEGKVVFMKIDVDEFDEYARELRRAKDQEEFDRFMADRERKARDRQTPDASGTESGAA